MKMISLRQPHAWAVIFGGKDIENRTRPTNYRGLLAIHASKQGTKRDYEDDCRMFIRKFKLEPPRYEQAEQGGIIGIVELTDVVTRHKSRWFKRRWFSVVYGLVLERPEPVEFYPCAGQVGIINAPEPWLATQRIRGGLDT